MRTQIGRWLSVVMLCGLPAACSSPQYQTLQPEAYEASDVESQPSRCVSSITRRHENGALLSQTESVHGRFSDVLQQRFDLDGDGHFERVIDQVYNEAGYLVQRNIDEEGDGEFDRRETLTYQDGNLIEHAFDDDLDFFADRVTLYAYNAQGAPTLVSIDEDGDFVPEHLEEFFYQAGRLVEHRKEDFGEPSFIEFFAYEGENMRHEIDEDGDGMWEWVHESFEGRRVRSLNEYDGDGRVDSVIEYRYDAQGRLLSVIKMGEVESSTFYLYGDQGRLTEVNIDEGSDGSLNGQERLAYDGPFLTMHSIDRQGDGILEWHYRAEVNEGFVVSAHSTLMSGEQRIETLTHFNDESDKVSERQETWRGEELSTLRVQSYERGRLRVERLDANADGIFEDITRMIYCD